MIIKSLFQNNSLSNFIVYQHYLTKNLSFLIFKGILYYSNLDCLKYAIEYIKVPIAITHTINIAILPVLGFSVTVELDGGLEDVDGVVGGLGIGSGISPPSSPVESPSQQYQELSPIKL